MVEFNMENHMKRTLFALTLLPALLQAHPGHPGPADHGDLTHALLGLLATLPVLGGTWLLLRARNRRLAKVAVRKDSRHG